MGVVEQLIHTVPFDASIFPCPIEFGAYSYFSDSIHKQDRFAWFFHADLWCETNLAWFIHGVPRLSPQAVI